MDDNRYFCRDPEASYTIASCSPAEAGDGLIDKGCYFSEGGNQTLPCGKICNSVLKGTLDEEQCISTPGCQTYLDDYCNSHKESILLPYGTRALLASVVVLVIIAIVMGICYRRTRSRRNNKYRIDRRGEQAAGGGGERGEAVLLTETAVAAENPTSADADA